ncbi:MAG: hypothetical protein CMO74_07565 [Verrucomicrobiales bacterium]|nr:hypothetical protein [Verrucomicrobiales bacterium]|tara:strand:+ start:1144 stop:1419 length:276 start_codon:yes stop_codon:yes gene_type:complete
MPPAFCPSCGAAIPEDAIACPECGSDEETGWSVDAHAQSLGLPDDDFDYDEFVGREFGDEPRELKPRGLHWFWWLVGAGLLTVLVWMWVIR